MLKTDLTGSHNLKRPSSDTLTLETKPTKLIWDQEMNKLATVLKNAMQTCKELKDKQKKMAKLLCHQMSKKSLHWWSKSSMGGCLSNNRRIQCTSQRVQTKKLCKQWWKNIIKWQRQCKDHKNLLPRCLQQKSDNWPLCIRWADPETCDHVLWYGTFNRWNQNSHEKN